MVSNCKCAKEHKVPANERQFLQDQRRQRKMIIGGIDQKERSKLKRKAERQEANLKRMKKLNTDESKSQADSDVSAKYDTHSSNDEYVPEPVKTKPEPDRQIKIMTKSLLSLAKTCDWTGVSDRSAAVLATSVHHDLGLVSPIDQSKVIDRSKIRRERRENRKELLQNGDQFDHSGIEGIFFDVRKDQTLTKEPGSSYFSHTTPQSGSSKDITKSLVASLKEVNAKTQNIKVVGCDGTNMNTGHTVGVIRRLEESFEHPLHWLVCLLHANELSLIFYIYKYIYNVCVYVHCAYTLVCTYGGSRFQQNTTSTPCNIST